MLRIGVAFVQPAIPRLPLVEGGAADPMLPSNIRRLPTGLLLPQDPSPHTAAIQYPASRQSSSVCPRAILRLDPVPKAHKCPHENTRVGGRPRLSQPIKGGGPNASVGTPSTLGKDGGGIARSRCGGAPYDPHASGQCGVGPSRTPRSAIEPEKGARHHLGEELRLSRLASKQGASTSLRNGGSSWPGERGLCRGEWSSQA